MKTMLVAAAMATAFAATAASAATVVVTPGTTTAGPFSSTPGNNITGFTPIKLDNKNTYDWAFNLTTPLVGAVASIQIEAQLLSNHSTTNENITFDLYQGAPGSGAYMGTSSTGTNADFVFSPNPGEYYVEITPTYIKQGANNEAFSGTLLIAPTPEPAAWALMLVGFGGLGLALRRRAAKSVAA